MVCNVVGDQVMSSTMSKEVLDVVRVLRCHGMTCVLEGQVNAVHLRGSTHLHTQTVPYIGPDVSSWISS